MERSCSFVEENGRTILPKAVRDALAVGDGDLVAFEIGTDGSIYLRRAAGDESYLHALSATLSDWDSPEDAAAFDGL